MDAIRRPILKRVRCAICPHSASADRLQDAVMGKGLSVPERYTRLRLVSGHRLGHEGNGWPVQYTSRSGSVPEQRFHLIDQTLVSTACPVEKRMALLIGHF